MMSDIRKLAIKYRAKLVMSNLRASHSGCDIHEVGNMLNTAQGILQTVDDIPNDGLDREKELHALEEMLGRVESQQLEFFKRKFQYLSFDRRDRHRNDNHRHQDREHPPTPETPPTPATPPTAKAGEPAIPNTPNTPNKPNPT